MYLDMCYDLGEFTVNNRLEQRIERAQMNESYGGLDDILHCLNFENCQLTYEWAVQLQNEVIRQSLSNYILLVYKLSKYVSNI